MLLWTLDACLPSPPRDPDIPGAWWFSAVDHSVILSVLFQSQDMSKECVVLGIGAVSGPGDGTGGVSWLDWFLNASTLSPAGRVS